MKRNNYKNVNTERGIVMLRAFRFGNCYSFRDETILSMVASDDTVNDSFLFEPEGARLLKTMAVYGANASGKTNLLRALTEMVKNITKSPTRLFGMPFMLNENNLPIVCEVEVSLKNVVYKYGYSFNDSVILKEWLLAEDAEGNFNNVFVRDGGKGKPVLNCNEAAIEGLIPTLKQSPRTLFLSLAGKTTVSPFCDIFTWCENAIQQTELLTEKNNDYAEFLKRLKNDGSYRTRVETFLNKFDSSIYGIYFKDAGKDSVPTIRDSVNLCHNHLPDDGSKILVRFPFDMESDGTKKIFSLYYPLFTALDTGSLLIVDELDQKLHPWIIRELIRLFHSGKANMNGAQLIFSAHSTACMDSNDLRLDEICFLEKDEESKSSLYKIKIDDIDKIDSDSSFGKYYLAGRFGATPNNFELGE